MFMIAATSKGKSEKSEGQPSTQHKEAIFKKNKQTKTKPAQDKQQNFLFLQGRHSIKGLDLILGIVSGNRTVDYF